MPLSNTDVSSKLGPATKKSIFERQKAEAEAKKAREKAETAAVLEDFVKSFEDDGNQTSGFSSKRGSGGENRGGFASGGSNHGPSGPGKRHFTSSGLKSGPGSLGPSPPLPKSGPGSLGPAPGFGRKRHYDEYSGRDRDRERDRDRDRRDRVFSYSDGRDVDNGRDSHGFAQDEEEDTRDTEELKAAAKPTLHLASLPPETSPAVVKALFIPSPLTVEGVRILPSAPGSATERKSTSAIVTLAAETPAADIETMVSHLQNKYLGFGFNLSISRHLSSAALTGMNSLSNNTPSANLNNLPFGAKPVPQHTSLSRAPPPSQAAAGNRFAPPASYTSSTPYGPRSSMPPTQVTVQVPNDLRQLRLIHKTIEALLTYGPEFEALLMSRPQIQRDEQWAWLWDSRSTGGVYYRWRLWEILTDSKFRRRQRYTAYGMRQPQGDILFEGQSTWIAPEEDLKFEYTTRLEEFISDDDYNSSDEEGIDDDNRGGGLARRYHDHQKLANVSDSTADNDGTGYLNPLAKTKLVHLLSRLPETNARLRRGDVARVTGFAIEHAGAGADEVAELVTRNVVRPFCYSVTRPKGDTDDEDDRHDDENGDGMLKDWGDGELSKTTEESDQRPKPKEKDTTPASLIGLYLISDILSASSTSGVRHAWRYRSLFQHHLLAQNVLPLLGKIPQKYEWGKLKAEKWKRQVQVVLGLWEGWCVFEEARMKEMVEGFLHPPLSEEEEKAKAKAEQDAEREKQKEKDKAAGGVSRWRSVGADAGANGNVGLDSSKATASVSASAEAKPAAANDGDVEMDMDGTPMAEDDLDDDEAEIDDPDEDGDTVLTDENIDGVPMVDSSDDDEQAPADHDHLQGRGQAQKDGGGATGADPAHRLGEVQQQTQPESQDAIDDSSATTTTTTAKPASSTSNTQAVEGGGLGPGGHQQATTKPANVPPPTTTAATTTTPQGRRVRPKAVDFDDMFE